MSPAAQKSLAEKLRLAIAREVEKGRSLRDIAREADVAHTIVAKFAKGGEITLTSAEMIAKALGVKTG